MNNNVVTHMSKNSKIHYLTMMQQKIDKNLDLYNKILYSNDHNKCQKLQNLRNGLKFLQKEIDNLLK